MRTKSLNARSRRGAVINNIPASLTWILLVTFGAALSVLVRSASTEQANAQTKKPVQVEARIPAEGYDKNHRLLPFTIYILSQQFSWKLESTANLEGGQTLVDDQMAEAIRQAQDVFCVGTASLEGATSTEEVRAAERASRLAIWIGPVIQSAKNTRVFSLNAGQYTGPRNVSSALQRKAIIIATSSHDNQVSLSEALLSGLKKQEHAYPVIYSLLHHYSRSDQWLKALEETHPPDKLAQISPTIGDGQRRR